ncbi:hypothetical protein JXA32_08990 [Candidatus Sumerlaeota bacterium]|nr:hypothetical protein [Candidatus Sumerlaeota bacterium]
MIALAVGTLMLLSATRQAHAVGPLRSTGYDLTFVRLNQGGEADSQSTGGAYAITDQVRVTGTEASPQSSERYTVSEDFDSAPAEESANLPLWREYR